MVVIVIAPVVAFVVGVPPEPGVPVVSHPGLIDASVIDDDGETDLRKHKITWTRMRKCKVT